MALAASFKVKMPETEALMFAALAVFVANLVKGIFSLGLPAMSLVLMVFANDLK